MESVNKSEIQPQVVANPLGGRTPVGDDELHTLQCFEDKDTSPDKKTEDVAKSCLQKFISLVFGFISERKTHTAKQLLNIGRFDFIISWLKNYGTKLDK